MFGFLRDRPRRTAREAEAERAFREEFLKQGANARSSDEAKRAIKYCERVIDDYGDGLNGTSPGG